MRITCIGGGPAGLYFSILMKKQDPAHAVTVLERNRPGVTFGWGVVFSDETLGYLEENDPPSHEAIRRSFARWTAIDVHFKGQTIRSVGHGFSGIARRELLRILEERALGLGVELVHEREVDDIEALKDASDLVFAADGVRSKVRERHAAAFRPRVELGRCKYMWLGTTRIFDAFTFLFVETPHGWLQVHAYRFDEKLSTFIVETDRETWEKTGFASMSTAESIALLERLFAPWLDGHPLLENRSLWIEFPTVTNERWSHDNVVLAGDAVHTAHFSIGSGTKLAMEDSIALARALGETRDVKAALERYETARRPVTARLQRAAAASQTWFENVRRHARLEPWQFTASLMTRSLRVSYANLKLRDPELIGEINARFAGVAPGTPVPPPLFTPFQLRGLRLKNRVVVSPMCMYSAADGAPTDFHLVHLGSRAMGGAGLVMAEMTDVLREGRISPGCAGMYAPEHVAAWRRITDFVHAHTSAAIGIQLGHAGRKGATCIPWQGGYDVPLPAGGWELLAPSPLPWAPGSAIPRAMDRADMDAVKAAFVAAARMAEQAGFDLIELHMAHGYLLASFLSPLTNRREDEYGGTLARRMRFPLEVFSAVRAAWPERKPIAVRLSASDWVEGGFTPEDAVEVARALQALGLDLLDVSAGGTVPEQQPTYGRMFQTGFSEQIRNETGLATMTVGAVYSADDVNSILAAGRADLVALAREHLRDPYFTLRAAREQGVVLQDWPAPYLAVRPEPPAAK